MSEKHVFTKAEVLPATAVAMTYDIGFTPSHVRIDAYSSPTVTNGKLTAGTYVGSLEWTDVMANGSALLNTYGSGGDVTTLITSLGITPAGSTNSYKGFSVGIQTLCNVAGYGWVVTAIRN